MLKIKILRSLGECTEYKSNWEKLVELMPYPTPFVHPDWILAVIQENEKKWEPYIILIKDKSEPIAFLPLYIKKKKYRIRELRFIGDSYYPDPLGLCCHINNRTRSIDAIFYHLNNCKDWDKLHLKFLMGEEASNWNNSGAETHQWTVEPFLMLPRSFDDYLKRFARKKRYNLNSSVRRFEKCGGRYLSANSLQEKYDYLTEIFSLHKKRSEERNIVSTFSGEMIYKFHKRLTINMKGVWYRALDLEGEIIAVLYGFLLSDRFFYYQIAHNPTYYSMSPGSVLLYKVIQECCELGVHEFNLLQGNEGYKSTWTKEYRNLHSVFHYNKTVAGQLSRFCSNTKRMIKNSIIR